MSRREAHEAEFEPKRASDFNPTPRLFTVRQMVAILAFIAGLQAIGGKFVIDSYIDARVQIHNHDPEAHSGITAAKADVQHEGEETRRQFRIVNDKLDATNQRLSRIEGALDRGSRR